MKFDHVLRAAAAGGDELKRQIAVRRTGHGDDCFGERCT